MIIHRLGSDEPVQFACAELSRYLGRAIGAPVAVEAQDVYDPDLPGLWVGTFNDFPLPIEARSSGHPFDDEVFVDVAGERGVIAGVNARSALLAAYRYLTEIGFRWVRPGEDGQYVPALGKAPAARVHVQETPSYRHRGLCIEGAVGWEHVHDIIDWLPKLGFNAYFVQFREGYQFFVRWYEHQNNPLIPPESFTVEDAREYTRRLGEEMRRRGMLLHMVGHGWTCEPFGVPGLGWMRYDDPLPEGYEHLLAEVNGKRQLWGGVPLNTNLCYGNPEVRSTMARAIADYAAENPQVQILHLWLADGSNNSCECPLCCEVLPSDLYVRLCNEVDAELTRRGLGTKIVFLIYVDLLWPPEMERFQNPDRFILMFAPITRSYTTSFTARSEIRNPKPEIRNLQTLPPFERNRLKFPKAPEANLAFLRGWQCLFQGDSFDFDYHLMWDHLKDPGYYGTSQVLHEDIRGLRDIGLNGLNSCQLQRAFFPTGLMMTVMGRALWNRDLPFDAIADDLYQASFGAAWEQAKTYTQRLSNLFDPPFLRGERDDAGRLESARKLEQVSAVVQAFLPAIEANLCVPDRCHARSWFYLKKHAELCLLMAPALAALARGEKEEAHRLGLQLRDLARRQEPETHLVFDTMLFLGTICRALGLTGEELAG